MAKPVNLLWTGGWDSTYRLLNLVLASRLPVRPYYMIQRARASLRLEIVTMGKIRDAIRSKDAAAADLVSPTVFLDVQDLRNSPARASQLNSLLAQAYLGDQYRLLAQFADHLGIDDLELCVHKDDKAAYFLAGRLAQAEDIAGPYHFLEDAGENEGLRLFDHYRFPILEMTKVEMQEDARRKGFLDIMERTWFCQEPTAGGLPCGVCNTCNYAREEGMGRRIPLRRRLIRPAVLMYRKTREMLHGPRTRAG